ncbi:uncharacterized protein [Aquarana catesbeiana]|uniref:uncharacterized protein isoform X2 n=1 Tax=Aquarana catesbeiana TaxID=8400 RepID=UPI003CC93028
MPVSCDENLGFLKVKVKQKRCKNRRHFIEIRRLSQFSWSGSGMDGTMRTGLKILHVICFLLLLRSGDFQVRGLTVTAKDVPIEALRGNDVTIPCLLSGVPIPLNLQIVSVVWTLRLRNGTEHEVYGFHSSSHQSSRPGSHMNDRNLQQGNASLSIPNIQIEDEGDYVCFVIVTPESGTTTSTLHVSVKPQAFIEHMIRIEDGYEGSVFCNVSNFYPKEVEIQWVKHSKGIIPSSFLDEDVSPTKQIRNSDGTFNVTSVLTVRPESRDEPRDVFSCIVSHRSLKEEISLNFTMPRWSPVRDISNAMYLVSILASGAGMLDTFVKKGWKPWIKVFLSALYISEIILLCFLLYFMADSDLRMYVSIAIFCTFMLSLKSFASFGRLLWKYFTIEWESKACPILTTFLLYFLLYLMVGDDLLTWLNFALFCTSVVSLIPFTSFGSFMWKFFTIGDLTVSEISGDYSITHMKRTTLTCQITDFRQKEIQINVYLKRLNDKKHLIASWESRGDNSHILPPLEEGAASRTLLPVEMEVKIRNCWTEMYECLCSITITPSADTDDGAVLYVEVEHASLTQPISVHRTLNVYSEVGD